MVKSEMLCTKEYILGLGCGPALEHVQDHRFSVQNREGERLRKTEIDRLIDSIYVNFGGKSLVP